MLQVGFMRNGVLIEEASPQYILNKYDTDSLESAFLALCCKRQENRVSLFKFIKYILND